MYTRLTDAFSLSQYRKQDDKQQQQQRLEDEDKVVLRDSDDDFEEEEEGDPLSSLDEMVENVADTCYFCQCAIEGFHEPRSKKTTTSSKRQ